MIWTCDGRSRISSPAARSSASGRPPAPNFIHESRMTNDVTAPTAVCMIGESEATRGVRDVARRIASGDAKVLITGESGVGKDVVARYIHALSARGSRPFVPV